MLSLEQQERMRREYGRLNPAWQPATAVYAALARGRLQDDSRLLDVGCGRGGLIEQLGHPWRQTVGIDPDYTSLNEHRLAALPRLAGLGRALPFADSSFDLVCASWVLEHLERPGDDLREIARVLRPGGCLVFLTPNRRHPVVWLNQQAGRFASLQRWLVARLYGRAEGDTFPVYYRANTAAEIDRAGRAVGLEVVEMGQVADPTYLAFSRGLFRAAVWLEGRLPAERRVHLIGCLRRPA